MAQYSLKLNWKNVDELFKLYNSGDEHGTRSKFIDKGLELFSFLSPDELCVIWQAFDRAAEEWMLPDFTRYE